MREVDQLGTEDGEILRAEVREILGTPADRAVLEPLVHNLKNGVTGGVWRVTAGDRSVVLKVLTQAKDADGAWAASDDPRHWNFWRREAHVYESGLARTWQPWGIRAPRLLASVDRPDGDVALWLEDVPGESGRTWSIARHAEHARRLGAAHGAALTDTDGTGIGIDVGVGVTAGADRDWDRPWLSRRFLRDYICAKTDGQELIDDDTAWRHPLVRDHFPAGVREAVVRLRQDREWFLGIMESLPRVFSHLDQWPANVVSQGPDSVLIDWAFAGDGALGEDLGNYVPDTVWDLFLPAARLPELAAAAYEAHVHGLRESGWRGDERLVRLGMCASAVKYDWLAPLMLARAGEARQLDYGGKGEVSAERRYRERGLAFAFLAGWAAEARELAPLLGFPPAPTGR
ncbi:aminoglycoside phosphotransferase [Streptomyces sp. NBC_01450]|uniref:aminoglycoside phosphotransferase n=1 Tax=Streptomyces sp. NBC_01450 TaxID=2903871 RepID=UPI002E35C873|nr:aminoglycoside phosphotransferase [Streptomyces sp. NBC_01450]